MSDVLGPWGQVSWIGVAWGPSSTADTFRLWRWTRSEADPGHTPALADPPGTTEPGLALLRGRTPVMALGRNPTRHDDEYRQWVLVADGGRWVHRWTLVDGAHDAVLVTVEGATCARWQRATRGTVRDMDRFVVGSAVYRPRRLTPPGRWPRTLPLTGLTVADESGDILAIGGEYPLTRDTSTSHPVAAREGTAPDSALWALTLAVLASVWDAQAAAVVG